MTSEIQNTIWTQSRHLQKFRHHAKIIHKGTETTEELPLKMMEWVLWVAWSVPETHGNDAAIQGDGICHTWIHFSSARMRKQHLTDGEREKKMRHSDLHLASQSIAAWESMSTFPAEERRWRIDVTTLAKGFCSTQHNSRRSRSSTGSLGWKLRHWSSLTTSEETTHIHA